MMNERRIRPNIHTIPEDVADRLVETIRSFAQVEYKEGDANFLDERERGRKSRDATLRGISLTCTNAHARYRKALLKQISFTVNHLDGFLDLAMAEPETCQLIKSLTLLDVTDNYVKWYALRRTFDPTLKLNQYDLMATLLGFLLKECKNLQVLVFESAFKLQLILSSKTQRGTIPYPFLTQSLKKLYLGDTDRAFQMMVTARNVIWMMTFCTQLRTLAAGFTVSWADANFLAECQEGFERKSKVKELAIIPHFIWDAKYDRNMRKYKPRPSIYVIAQSNIETQCIYNFLQATNKLESFEITGGEGWEEGGEPKQGSQILVHCLLALETSRTTLRNLRLASILHQRSSQEMVDFSKFTNLKLLSLDLYLIASFVLHPGYAPPNVEVIHLISYVFDEWDSPPNPQDWDEEKDLNTLLTNKSFPNLKEVFVPARPWNFRKRVGTSPSTSKGWREARELLKKNYIFENGNVKLTPLEMGATVGDYEKGENCISHHEWICPFPRE